MHHSLTVIVPVHNQLEHLKVCCDIVLANFRIRVKLKMLNIKKEINKIKFKILIITGTISI